jgi:hypothetical protein
MIFGAAEIRFSEKKANVDVTQDKIFITPVNDDPIPINWDNSREVDIKISDLNNKPTAGISYSDLPRATLRAKNYSDWKKDFSNWLARTQKISLLQSSHLKEFSKPGENERDFRIRLQQIAREARDQQAEKLRDKYASAFKRLDERIRRAEMVLEEQKAQARGQKYQTAVSIGETLLGAFLGRKSSTRATRTTREISRGMKESRDRENAEENLKALQQERAKIEAQFKSEVDNMEANFNPLTEKLENVLIAPIKTNVSVQAVALVWTAN